MDSPEMHVNKGTLVYASDYDGTVIHVYGCKGAPCTRLSLSIPIEPYTYTMAPLGILLIETSIRTTRMIKTYLV